MKKLSTRGLLTVLVVVGTVAMSMMPNTNNHETRTMRVYEVKDEITYLVDGNGEIYGMTDEVICKYEDLLVAIDNQGTKDLKDDVILSWRYKN